MELPVSAPTGYAVSPSNIKEIGFLCNKGDFMGKLHVVIFRTNTGVWHLIYLGRKTANFSAPSIKFIDRQKHALSYTGNTAEKPFHFLEYRISQNKR